MLQSLHIENVAVIERADITFGAGLTVLTGETGAGKSIVIDAINAVLGERITRDVVRHGAERAYISAVFGDVAPAVTAALDDAGGRAAVERAQQVVPRDIRQWFGVCVAVLVSHRGLPPVATG